MENENQNVKPIGEGVAERQVQNNTEQAIRKTRVFMIFQCGCGYVTTDLNIARLHVARTRHAMCIHGGIKLRLNKRREK
jgi:hypothetical protein